MNSDFALAGQIIYDNEFSFFLQYCLLQPDDLISGLSIL